MFERSLLSSASVKKSSVTRWTVVISLLLQGLALAGLVVFPMLYPATLPRFNGSPRMVPLVQFHQIPKPKVIPVKLQPAHTSLTAALEAPSRAPVTTAAHQPGMISHAPAHDLAEAPMLPVGGGMSTAFTLANGPGSGKETIGMVVAEAAPKPAPKPTTGPLRISSGVSAGLLLTPIQPMYPRLAVVSKQQGTVIITAVIDRSGRITQAQVVSGPMLLRTAAVDAVQGARYRPFLLNGEPTDVVTTISITFHLAS